MLILWQEGRAHTWIVMRGEKCKFGWNWEQVYPPPLAENHWFETGGDGVAFAEALIFYDFFRLTQEKKDAD
jgi:hypothetical protein